MIRLIFRVYLAIYYRALIIYTQFFGRLLLIANNAKIGKNIKIYGLPSIYVHQKGLLKIGDYFSMNSGNYFNQIGRQQQTIIQVAKNAKLVIGNKVGVSSSAIICMHHIEIGNNVKIGGNVVIYDSDFHSLNANDRIKEKEDPFKIKVAEVKISDNAFIGAHSTILKGVHIGQNSIIGAGSVVTKSVPSNQIWGGNPACFIKEIF